MKKLLILTIVLTVALSLVLAPAVAAKGGKNAACTTIQEGNLTYSDGHYLAGEPLKVGYDIFGYNYQAHMFSGYYCNVYLGGAGFPPYEGDTAAYLLENPGTGAKNHWAWPYRDVKLVMKWNDAWLSNKSCDNDGDNDGKLDRHYGYDSYIGSGAWETNHQWGDNEDGTKWTYFTKIVAAPKDAYNDGIIWYAADDTEIGPIIWGAFATIQEVSNDPALNEHGILYKSPAGPGFGKW